MAQVHVGTRVETGVPSFETTVRLAKAAEAFGYDSVWIRDHVAIPETTGANECLEVFAVMAGLARETTRVELGSLVLCNPWRNPALVAKIASTIDVMAGGRVIVGFGAGANGRALEFERYGFAHGSPGDRVRALGEAMQICRLMWTEEHPSFQGRYYTIDDAICEPKPVRVPPILVGGGGPQLLRQTVLHADGWNTAGTIEAYRPKAELVDQLCEEAGRDPGTLFRSTNQACIVDTTREKAEGRKQRLLERNPGMAHKMGRLICGSPQDVAEAIRPFLDLGVNHIVAYFWEPEITAQLENMQVFAEEVVPLLRQA